MRGIIPNYLVQEIGGFLDCVIPPSLIDFFKNILCQGDGALTASEAEAWALRDGASVSRQGESLGALQAWNDFQILIDHQKFPFG